MTAVAMFVPVAMPVTKSVVTIVSMCVTVDVGPGDRAGRTAIRSTLLSQVHQPSAHQCRQCQDRGDATGQQQRIDGTGKHGELTGKTAYGQNTAHTSAGRKLSAICSDVNAFRVARLRPR